MAAFFEKWPLELRNIVYEELLLDKDKAIVPGPRRYTHAYRT